MNTSFCKSCGAQLQPGYQVCPHCGTPVNAQQQPVVPQQQPMPINNQPMGTQPMQQPMSQQPGYQQ